ncbi:AN1-type zinc finger protein 3 [Cyanistes caeruleus]|uniref:AN1-type zinc finger protein 3 n=1 Tax=Cyanistes caeruleus TaxID=156563 RepID=UPI000CDB40B4|nr:AN1-type zinc finger protein 3 [Cyanistes caeruleus]
MTAYENSGSCPCLFSTDSQSESEASPVKRPRLLDDSNNRPEEASRSKQKSRRRCFQCQTKLELVQQELGSCRCGEYCLSVQLLNATMLRSVSHMEYREQFFTLQRCFKQKL